MKTKNQPYDIIGDIHGYADTLRALLAKLGYVERDGVYRHSERTAIFLGDFIDRGPKIRETLQIVKAMMDAGTALAVMGNHEYNAIAYHTPDGRGGHLRSHTADDGKNVTQHQATLDQIAIPVPEEWAEWLSWFKALPLLLDLGDLRIVHACWNAQHIAFLNGDNRLHDELLHKSAEKGTQEYRAIEALLKGPEFRLPEPHTFTDKGGIVRRDIRMQWWLGGAGHTYHSLCMPECATVPKIPVPATNGTARGYAATEPPTFIGHYWLPPARPEPLAPNLACVDYSVAKDGGMLVAYRWDGERVLDAGKFVAVSRGASVEKPFKVLVDDNYHFMDEDERYELGNFPTLEAAIAASKQIVDDFLLSGMKQGTTAKELYSGYVAFGEDPWVATGDGVRHFSAWDYAKRRCDEICGK